MVNPNITRRAWSYRPSTGKAFRMSLKGFIQSYLTFSKALLYQSQMDIGRSHQGQAGNLYLPLPTSYDCCMR